ncbi:MAG: endo-1,4-beta-xylanase xyn5A [Prevotella sp.]|nr:endo-1,4-beta-xylanase xyn5A [Prevotella sp.]
MRRLLLLGMLLLSGLGLQAATITVTVDSTRYQTITGFGAAACWGAMRPMDDVEVIKLLYGPDSPVGLNIVRMEISPNMKGDITAADIGWDTPYDWHGYLNVVKEAKRRGAILYACPWSPPGEYKTNGISGGGNSEEQGYQKGELRTDCYDKFFDWLNTFLVYMRTNKANVDVVSLQNEPDWWVSYSGCLYTPEQLHDLVLKSARRLKKTTYQVKLMTAESLNYNPKYSDALLNDPETAKYFDMTGGHLYGKAPLDYMATAAVKARELGKEVWMTEHSVENDKQRDGLPTWHEELLFAEELNESMLAGANAYVYWYMMAHWSFVGTGEAQHQPGCDYGKLLRRGYVMSHFSKNLTGSTRLGATASVKTGTNSAFETSAYVKGDSLIVMAIDTTKNALDLKLVLPYKVKGGEHLLSTEEAVCQQQAIELGEPVSEVTVSAPARSLNTYIFQIDREATGIEQHAMPATASPAYYNLQGIRLNSPQGLTIERQADGSTRKTIMR